jgi:hypothetical protein
MSPMPDKIMLIVIIDKASQVKMHIDITSFDLKMSLAGFPPGVTPYP